MIKTAFQDQSWLTRGLQRNFHFQIGTETTEAHFFTQESSLSHRFSVQWHRIRPLPEVRIGDSKVMTNTKGAPFFANDLLNEKCSRQNILGFRTNLKKLYQ